MNLFLFQEGETVLISAARDGHLEVVRTLLSKYADIEAVDSVSAVSQKFYPMSVVLRLGDGSAETRFFFHTNECTDRNSLRFN